MGCLFSCCCSNATEEATGIAPQAPEFKEYNSCWDRTKQAVGGCGLSTVGLVTSIVGVIFGVAGAAGGIVTYEAFAAGLISTGFIGLGITVGLVLIAIACVVATMWICACAKDYVVKQGEAIQVGKSASAARQAVVESTSDRTVNQQL